jgi:SAM-dependent methyltransferase
LAADGNLERYNTPTVVSHYEQARGLQACEQYLFDRYITPRMTILDVGVGGGRTTEYLSRIASRYVGVDYSRAMIDSCRRNWPTLEFYHCDASDMAQFANDAFDAVVFSFNGIDCIRTDQGRARCFAEVARVLKSGGVFLFSSHNARLLGLWPVLDGARLHQMLWRTVRCLYKSPLISVRAVVAGIYAAGEGYILDPVHGGMHHYVSTPSTIAPQLAAAGFSVIETVGARYPTLRARSLTPWYYYSCRKMRATK